MPKTKPRRIFQNQQYCIAKDHVTIESTFIQGGQVGKERTTNVLGTLFAGDQVAGVRPAALLLGQKL